MRMINPASVHDIIIFYLRNICAITKTQFTIQNALLRNNQTARGHVEKLFSLSYCRPLIYIMIAGHVVIDKSPIFRPVTFLVAFGVVSVAQWAHSTGKVPSNNVRLRPPRTVKMLLTEAGQSSGKFCPRSNWRYGDLDLNLTCLINYH